MSQQRKLLVRLATFDQEMTWNRLGCCPSSVQKRTTYIPVFALLLLLVGTTYLSTFHRETITFTTLAGIQANCSKQHDVTKEHTSKTSQGPVVGNLQPSFSNRHPEYFIATVHRRNGYFAKNIPKRMGTEDRNRKRNGIFSLALNAEPTYGGDWVQRSHINQPLRDDRSYGSTTHSSEPQSYSSSQVPFIAKLFEDNVRKNIDQKIYFKRFDKWKKASNISFSYFIPQISRLSFTEKTALWKRSLPYRPKDVDLMAQKPFTFLESYRNPCWIEHSLANYSGSFYTSRNDVSHELAVMAELLDKRRRIRDFHRVRCLPYFLIIGQPKCGSTDLYRKIIAHPDVCNIPPGLKEPHWWARARLGRQSARGHVVSLKSYVDLFDYAAYRIETETETDEEGGVVHHKITGEGSMSTFWDNDHWWAMEGNENISEPRVLNPDYIHHVIPNAKPILILRNPTTRMYSDFLYFRKDRKLPVDFHEAVVNAVRVYKACMRVQSVRSCVYNATTNQRAKIRLRVGMYAVFLEDWLRVFPRQQLFIVRTEDYAEDPRAVLRDIYAFLELRNLTVDEEESILSMRKANTRRKQDIQIGDMLPETKVLLDDFYKPYNEQLARMLGDSCYLWDDSWS